MSAHIVFCLKKVFFLGNLPPSRALLAAAVVQAVCLDHHGERERERKRERKGEREREREREKERERERERAFATVWVIARGASGGGKPSH
jgi:hypothetical protein